MIIDNGKWLDIINAKGCLLQIFYLKTEYLQLST